MSITGLRVKLSGEDGNAFFIIGRTIAIMRKAKIDPDIINEYKIVAMSGDYNNALATTADYVDVY